MLGRICGCTEEQVAEGWWTLRGCPHSCPAHIGTNFLSQPPPHTKTRHIITITGFSITQTMETTALDTQTPLQRRSTQSGCDSGQQRGSGMPIGESLFDSQCGKRFFRSAKHQDRFWVRPRLLFDGYQVLFFTLRETAGAWSLLPPLNAEVKNRQLFLHYPVRAHGVMRTKHRASSTPIP